MRPVNLDDVSEKDLKNSRKNEKKLMEFSPYGKEGSMAMLDTLEKEVDLTESSLNMNEGRLSSGVLMKDLYFMGGYAPGMYTNSGFEQSAKSTDALEALLAGVKQGIPILGYFDYEGSTEPKYVENIMKKRGIPGGVSALFGEKDNKGAWIIEPRVRYRSEAVAEKFFDYVAGLERRLPDKRLIGGKWWYLYDSVKLVKGKEVSHTKNKEIVGDRYDKDYFRATGKYRVPAPDGTPQALIVVDSYPNMLPEGQDVDDPGHAMALQARMFSSQLPRIKGRMRGKRIIIVGVNALRTNPMAKFSNPEYEPGGNALQQFSDVRNKYTSRSLSGVPENPVGKGQIEEEESVLYEGTDTYRYIALRQIKNKLSTQIRDECWLRIWMSDPNGDAWGIDLVYDTYSYLKATGQIDGGRKKMFFLKLAGKDKAKKPMPWKIFKLLILGSKEQWKKIYPKLGMKPINLRRFCEKQLAQGNGLEMFYETRRLMKNDKTAKDAAMDGDEE